MQQAVAHDEYGASDRRLTFPVKLRCHSLADLADEAGVERALTRALTRAFARARSSLARALATGDGVILHAPRLVSPNAMSDGDTAPILECVRRAAAAAARAQALPLHVATPHRRMATPARSVARPAHEVSERFEPARFDSQRSTYEIPSYDGGKTQAKVVAKKDPLERLNAVAAEAMELVDALIDDQVKFAFADDSRVKLVKALRDERVGLVSESMLYRDFSAKLIEKRLGQIEAAIALMTLVRPHLVELDRQAAQIGVVRQVDQIIATTLGRPNDRTDTDFVRDVCIELGDAYLSLVLLHVKVAPRVTAHAFGAAPPLPEWLQLHDEVLKESFEQLWFMVAYYSDPKVMLGVAGMRFAAGRLAQIWDQLGKVRPPGDGGQPAWPDLADKPPKADSILQYANPGPSPSEQVQRIQEATVFASFLHQFLSKGAVLPKTLSEVTGSSSPADIKVMSALLYHLQVELIILGLWQNIPVIYKVIGSVPGITKTFFGPDLDIQWGKDIYKLEDEFNKELALSNWAHPNIQAKIDGWQARINTLFDEVKSAARRTALTKMAITFVFSLVITFGVSTWLNIVLQGSKLLLILAEGAALTAINTGLGAMQGQNVTLKGVALDFGLNTALVGLGPLLKSFRSLATIEEQLARSRPLLTALGKGASMIAVTTAGQFGVSKLLDDQAEKAGGETSTTEMLTINFIFNTLAMLAGAGLHKFTEAPKGGPPIDAKALVLRLQAEAKVTISENSAQKLLDLQGQLATFQRSMQEMQAAARSGALTEHQYKMWQGRGEALVAELEDIPELGKLFGLDVEPAEMKSMLDRMKSALRRPFQAQLVLALPEFAGLTRVGEGNTWIYDPKRLTDTKRLDAVKARFALEPGATVRELPGGGWEVLDANGQTRIQVLPAGPQLAGLLEPPLRGMVQGERAQGAADLIDAQSAAPELGSAIKALMRGSAKPSAQKILEAIGRPGGSALSIADDAAWRGLSNYLRQGGDPARLAQLLTFREGNLSAEANNQYARRILASMDGKSAADLPKTARLLSFTGKATQEGLAAAQQQSFVPELEVLLENAAGSSPDAVKDLLPTLRFLNPSDSTPWLGLRNFLRNGGSVRVLNTALGFRGPDVSQFRPDLVNQAMGMVNDWSPQAIRGLATLERLNATAKSKGRKYANLFFLRTEDPAGVASSLENLAALEPKIDTKDPASLTGLRKVLGALSAEDTPAQVQQTPSGNAIPKAKAPSVGNAPNITGAVGALRAGAKLAGEFTGPDTFLRFESPHEVVNEATGEVLGRAYDLEVLQHGKPSAPGKLAPPDKVLRRAEIKEISSAKSLSTTRVLHEFATDIVADAEIRIAALNAGEPAPQPLENTRWMIRDSEIRAQARDNVRSRIDDPAQNFDLLGEGEKNDMIDLEMRQMVKAALEPALRDSSLAGLPLGPYRAALNDPALRFVVFF